MPPLKLSRFLLSTNPTLPFSSFLPPLFPGNHHHHPRQRRRVSMDSTDNTNISSTSTNNNKKELGSRVDRLRQVIHSHHSSGGKNWEMSWEQGLTPWDLGQPTPVLLHLLQTGQLPKGRALVPGCGTGYDVIAIACPERYVVGLDVSEVAVKKAKQLSSTSPNADYLTFLKEDFFNWHPPELFDLIFDYTFFCAIEQDMRSAWARQTCNLLKPDGELITLMFPVSDHVGGPPYKVSVANYEEVLRPVGFKAMSVVENELAVGPRKGREILARWMRLSGNSSL